MNMRVEAVARAICEAEGLAPDAMIDDPDYVGGVRSGDHTQVVQWQAKIAEAAKFVRMHEALTASGYATLTTAGEAPAVVSPGSFRLDESELGGEDTLG